MSQTFDIKRFGKVLAYDIRRLSPRNFRSGERTGNMGINIISFAFMPVVISLVTILIGEQAAGVPVWVRWYILLFMAGLMACLAPEVHYNAVNQKKGGSYYAMLPASKLEKYLSMLLMTLVVCPLLTFCGAFVVDTLITLLPLHVNEGYLWQTDSLLGHFGINPYEGLPAIYSVRAYMVAIFGYILFAMAFVFGNTLFRKSKTALTMLCLFGIGFVVSVVSVLVTAWLVADLGIEIDLADRVMNVATGSIYGWVNNIGLGMQVLLITLLVYYSWRRIKRMGY